MTTTEQVVCRPKYTDPFKHPGSIQMSAQLFVEMSAEAEKLITEAQFFTGINDSGCGGASGYSVFDHALDYVVQDDLVFRQALESEMYCAMLNHLYGTHAEIRKYSHIRVSGIVESYRACKTLSLFDWEVLLGSMHSFIKNGCSERTEFVFEPDECPNEEESDCSC